MRAHPAGPRHGDVAHPAGAPPKPADTGELLALDPQIWPRSARRQPQSGAMEIGGCDVRDLATEFGTPLFVMDERDVRGRAKAYAEAFNDPAMPADVYYAAKAFLCTTVARWVSEEGLGVDVCSGGELACALRAGVPAERILMHGNNKSVEELHAAISAGVGRIVLDSFEEIARAAFIAEELGVCPKVLVRVTLGVEAHTHEFIATAHEDQKFGFSLATGTAAEAIRRVVAVPSLELIGLHSHIGSQIFVSSGFEIASARIVSLLAEARDEFGVELSELNLGGGLGIKYIDGDEPPVVEQMAQTLREIVAAACEKSGLELPRLAFEPGRAIVGPAGTTLYTVGTVKPIELDGGGVRTYVSIDGGMSDNIRTALYDAEYTVTLASRTSQAGLMLCRVVGKHCESGDIVVSDAWLPSDLTAGDLLAVAATGAYNRSMASNYNLVTRPPVLGVRDGNAQIMLRRETLEDLFALDPG
ncbi:MAG: diaminopimelate decarboxylase [Candidatus Nanopelagicales bacterium]